MTDSTEARLTALAVEHMAMDLHELRELRHRERVLVKENAQLHAENRRLNEKLGAQQSLTASGYEPARAQMSTSVFGGSGMGILAGTENEHLDEMLNAAEGTLTLTEAAYGVGVTARSAGWRTLGGAMPTPTDDSPIVSILDQFQCQPDAGSGNGSADPPDDLDVG